MNHDYNADKKAEGEGESHEPTNNWWNVVRGSFRRLHGSSWIQNFGVNLLFLLIAPAVGLIMKNPIVIIWGAACGLIIIVVVLAIVFTCELQKPTPNTPSDRTGDVGERLLRSADLLQPSNEPTPALNIPPGRPPGVPEEAVTVADSEMVLFVGDLAVSTSESEYVVLKLYGKELLKITKAGTGVSISADIWDENGKIAATIEKNRFRVNPNNTLPIIRPDPHTLVVEDERKVRVLSVRFLNPSTIKIEGMFRAGGKYPVIIDEHKITFGPLLIGGGIALHIKGRAIFEWPGTFPGAKVYLAPTDNIEVGKAVLGMATNDGAVNLILKDSRGDEYSLFQIGGPDVPKGTHIWSAFDFQLRDTGSY